MTILFAGGEIGAFIPSDSNVGETTGSGTYDSAFARCSLTVTGSSAYAESFTFASQDDFWVHLDLNQLGATNSASVANTLVLVDGSGVEQFRIACNWDNSGTGLWALQYKSGGVWSDFGTQITSTLNDLQTLDMHIVCNSASGSGALYFSGTKRIEGTGINLSGITGIVKLRCYGKTTVIQKQNYYSQVIVADESTIGWRLKTAPATGAGASTAWTGTYTEIDEVAYSDVDFINTSANDQDELFTHSITVPTGYAVRGVAVTARAKEGGSGPTNLQLALRSAGTTYYTSSQALDLGYGAHVGIWEDDPATAADFTTSAITTLQFGVRSKA